VSILDDNNLNTLARKKSSLDYEYHEAWKAATANTRRLDVNRFWAILELFRTDILVLNHGDASKHACDELFRLCACNELMVCGKSRAAGGGLVTFDDLVRFIENYTAVVAALYDHLHGIVQGKSDDAYSDLCGNLPLIGREGVRALLEMSPVETANEEIVQLITDNDPGHHGWYEFIWYGENYFCMFLDEEAERRYVSEACQHDPQPEVYELV
jgi:hypothetical protein